jgi:hypothetical protein
MRDGPPTVSAEELIDAIAGEEECAVALLRSCKASGALPLSLGACLFAAVKLRRTTVVKALLEGGAPAHNIVGELPPADLVALRQGGVAPDGVHHWSPLVIAVRQQSLEVVRMLLEHGAPAGLAVDGTPLLLHLNAVLESTTPSNSGSGAAAGSSGSDAPFGGNDSSLAGGVLQANLRVEERLQLLLLLLRHQADPLQPCEAAPQRCFLTGEQAHTTTVACARAAALSLMLLHSSASLTRLPAQPPPADCRDPWLLRLTVNYVRQQCEQGRRVSDLEARQLVQAAARAWLDLGGR